MEKPTLSQNKNQSIKVLGASGGKSLKTALTSFEVATNIIIDAGNILNSSHEDISKIEHIFITHTHLDHILDIAFLIDNTFETRTKPLKIYARVENLQNLKKHIFNWDIWPDFTKIKLLHGDLNAVELIPIELNHSYTIEETTLIPIKNNHTKYSNGFLIKKGTQSLLLSSDTYCCDNLWEIINRDQTISTLIIDVSFPSRMEKLAFDSKHLTPKILEKELTKLQRDDITLHICHLKPSFEPEIKEELQSLNLLLNGGTVLQTDEIIEF